MLSENFFNEVLFTGHTLTASSSAANHPAWHVGTGRRQPAQNYWTPSSTGADSWIAVQCDVSRSADMLAIDRAHNLAGQTVRLQTSADGVVWGDLISFVVPSTLNANADLDSGAATEEGAFVRRFTATAALHWRVFVDSMGAGNRPKIMGLHLGTSFSPANSLVKPFSHGEYELTHTETTSPHGHTAAGTIAQKRRGSFRIECVDRSEWAVARLHIDQRFLRRRPTWLVLDDAEAEKALLAVHPTGVAGFKVEGQWSEYQGEFSYAELGPRLVA